MNINAFNKICYINLKHRTDRKERILKQLLEAGAHPHQIVRIEAHLDPLNGHRGCAISHMKAIQFALQHQLDNVLILEDDFVFIQPKATIDAYIDNLFSFSKEAWDVFLLGSNVIEYEATTHPEIKRVLCAQTAHSYAINRSYMPMLIDCFTYALKLMENDIFSVQSADNLHAIDHVWKLLQPHGRWYIGKETIGEQGASFSDIALDEIKRFNRSFYP